MTLFTKLKHWQIFLIFVSTVFLPSLIEVSHKSLFFIQMLTYLFIYFGWLISIAELSNKILSETQRSTPISLYVCGLISFVFLIYFTFMVFDRIMIEPGSSFTVLHLAAMVSVFYSMGYTAKKLNSAIVKEEVKFRKSLGMFLGFWFFFVGVWFIQPKVNSLLEQKNA